ncbi:hypothetical protein [Luteolibacter sp.]|uniref:hypothetical protein n=1 Tax=Luteolibacter sp. TaxID=1962973 RepID=UPI003263CB74
MDIQITLSIYESDLEFLVKNKFDRNSIPMTVRQLKMPQGFIPKYTIAFNDLNENIQLLAKATLGKTIQFSKGDVRPDGFQFNTKIVLTDKEREEIRYCQAIFPFASLNQDPFGVKKQFDRKLLTNLGGEGPVRVYPNLKMHKKKIPKLRTPCIYEMKYAFSEIGCDLATKNILTEILPENLFKPMVIGDFAKEFQYYHITGMEYAPKIALNSSIPSSSDWKETANGDIWGKHEQGGLFSMSKPIGGGDLLRFRDPFFLQASPHSIVSKELLALMRANKILVNDYPIIEPGTSFRAEYEERMSNLLKVIKVNPKNRLSMLRLYPGIK